jgi:hypothetical protein
MKFKVNRYYPNFFEGFDTEEQIVEISNKQPWNHIQPVDVYMQVPYLNDKIGHLSCQFNTFIQSLVLHITDERKYPYAWIELIEL